MATLVTQIFAADEVPELGVLGPSYEALLDLKTRQKRYFARVAKTLLT
jgi:hypothetical protein